MKQFIFLTLILISSQSLSQNKSIAKVQLEQYGRVVSPKNGIVNIDQAPFNFIIKTLKEPEANFLGILSFTHQDSIPNNKFENASTGGAFSYDDSGDVLYVWEETRMTYLPFENDSMHCFDSVSYKGKWMTAVYTIDEISTQNGHWKIEDYEDSTLSCFVASMKYDKSGINLVKDEIAIKIRMHPQKIKIDDVRGKTYSEEPGEYQEGCEGCGNAAYFQFSKDGHTIEYLLSGSDMISLGNYRQEGNQVYISDTEYSFTVSEDGLSLSDNLYEGYIYILEEGN